jgi:hypothetical protein
MGRSVPGAPFSFQAPEYPIANRLKMGCWRAGFELAPIESSKLQDSRYPDCLPDLRRCHTAKG